MTLFHLHPLLLSTAKAVLVLLSATFGSSPGCSSQVPSSHFTYKAEDCSWYQNNNKARPFFNLQNLLKLYYASIHSHITYSITSWANTYPSHILPLQRLQNQAIRIITFISPVTCVSPLFQQHSVLTVCNLFKYKLGILVFRCLNGTITAIVLEKFQLLNSNPTRFASNNFFTTTCTH